jgi:hypothetical protein
MTRRRLSSSFHSLVFVSFASFLFLDIDFLLFVNVELVITGLNDPLVLFGVEFSLDLIASPDSTNLFKEEEKKYKI